MVKSTAVKHVRLLAVLVLVGVVAGRPTYDQQETKQDTMDTMDTVDSGSQPEPRQLQQDDIAGNTTNM